MYESRRQTGPRPQHRRDTTILHDIKARHYDGNCDEGPPPVAAVMPRARAPASSATTTRARARRRKAADKTYRGRVPDWRNSCDLARR